MNIIAKSVCIFLLVAITSCDASETRCYLNEDQEGGVIYKECEGSASKVPFDYKVFVVSLSDDVPSRHLAILWQTPRESRMSDERYFIFDYENMLVYDDKCLGGNFIMLEEKQNIVFEKYGEDGYVVFDRKDYSTCEKPLSVWVNSQRKW